jgi:hypothetical protein
LYGAVVDRLTDNQILACLEADEAASRLDRATRMRLLIDLFGQDKGRLFFGGVVPVQAFEEMRLAYLHGLYVSCVVVSQIVIEHILAGVFDMFDRADLEGAGFQKLVEEACTNGYISQEESSDIDRLRRLRNPYVHSKPVAHPSSIFMRAAETRSHPVELFKQDAETALGVVAALLSRCPFSISDGGSSSDRIGGESDTPSAERT